MSDTPDKPEGTEQHPPNHDPARQGPDRSERPERDEAGQQRQDAGPPQEGSPGEPGVTTPKR
jgi:hypothetical protein